MLSNCSNRWVQRKKNLFNCVSCVNENGSNKKCKLFFVALFQLKFSDSKRHASFSIRQMFVRCVIVLRISKTIPNVMNFSFLDCNVLSEICKNWFTVPKDSSVYQKLLHLFLMKPLGNYVYLVFHFSYSCYQEVSIRMLNSLFLRHYMHFMVNSITCDYVVLKQNSKCPRNSVSHSWENSRLSFFSHMFKERICQFLHWLCLKEWCILFHCVCECLCVWLQAGIISNSSHY